MNLVVSIIVALVTVLLAVPQNVNANKIVVWMYKIGTWEANLSFQFEKKCFAVCEVKYFQSMFFIWF